MRWIKICILAMVCQFFSACKGQPQRPDGYAHTNRLIASSSPYLLQHAHNPVDWFPWGEEALQKAKAEDKLLIISIGYSACHWCHVMEHESFEDSTVAAKMNESFVSIKVDREERPDIDQIYMNAAYLTNGRGGWPLNAIALPDGRPIFAATYFPKKDWLRVIDHFANFYQDEEKRPKLIEAAESVSEGIQNLEWSELSAEDRSFSPANLVAVYQKIIAEIDMKRGGFNKSPKFPMPNVYQFLLRYHYLNNDDEALQAVLTTLDNMADGGIYDHLGGGFSRYSVDASWKVPHFEKMLYDNGQLVSLYSEAYQITKDERYKQLVYETLGYIEREMTSAEGGFYSSLDADSEGEEGKFYVWTAHEIDSLLGGVGEVFSAYYSVSKAGNWEHSNILHITQAEEKIAEKFGLSIESLNEMIQSAKPVLLDARAKRIRPGLDDKTLTSWNALMLKGYVDAYRALGEEKYLQAALNNARFLKKNMIQSDARLNRSYKDGKSSINAFLDDYSFLIEAYVALYQATFEEEWLYEAEGLMKYTIEHFFDEKTNMFFYTSDEDKALLTRSKEVADNVIPASNSSIAKGLFYLGTYLYNDDYLRKSKQMLQNVMSSVEERASYFSNWCILLSHYTHEPFEIAIVGENFEEIRKEFDQYFLPDAFFLGGATEGGLQLLENKKVEGKTVIYVCQNKSCKLPQTDVNKALGMLRNATKIK